MTKAQSASDKVYAVSDFTRELVEDVARDRYRFGAWWTFLSRSWVRSLDDMRAVPARVRSSLLWTTLGAAIGAGMILLAATGHAHRVALFAATLWLPWYAGTVFFLFTHLGMVDDGSGSPHSRLLLPNGLSFLRLGLAPLVLWPCLSTPTHHVTAPVFAAFLVALTLSDVLDGFVARRMRSKTRMGRMLDPMADMALATFLAIGLLAAGILPIPLFALIMIRYPGALLGVLLLYLARGPRPIRPTAVVRVTALMSNVVLVTAALTLLLQPEWLTMRWFDWSLQVLYVAVTVNLVHLVWRGVRWQHGLDEVTGKHPHSAHLRVDPRRDLDVHVYD